MKTNSTTRTKNLSEVATDLRGDSVMEIWGALHKLLADVFTLYVKTKNFHWHMSGKHFRDYHLLLAEQSSQIFAMTDDIAERARKIGGTTIRSIRAFVSLWVMVFELRAQESPFLFAYTCKTPAITSSFTKCGWISTLQSVFMDSGEPKGEPFFEITSMLLSGGIV